MWMLGKNPSNQKFHLEDVIMKLKSLLKVICNDECVIIKNFNNMDIYDGDVLRVPLGLMDAKVRVFYYDRNKYAMVICLK